jgi:hypothetical protein
LQQSVLLMLHRQPVHRMTTIVINYSLPNHTIKSYSSSYVRKNEKKKQEKG